MTWYAAHIITYIRFLDGVQDKFPVWENVVLIKETTDEEALRLAENIGRERYTRQDPSFSYEDKPAEWVFAGIRKLIECSFTFDAAANSIQDSLPELLSGTEVTYSAMEVDSIDALRELVDGNSVKVQYEE